MKAQQPATPNPFLLVLKATRAQFLTASVVPALVGGALGWNAGQGGQAWTWVSALLALVLFHSAANLLNDYTDEVKGSDRANQAPTPFSGGSRILQEGLLSLAEVKLMAGLFLAGGLLCAVVVCVQAGWLAVVILAAGVASLLAYNTPGVFAMGRGWGEVLVGLAFGPLAVGWSELAACGRIDSAGLLSGIVLGCLVSAILVANELPDAPADEATGKRTLVVALGLEGGVKATGGLLILAWLVLGGGVGLRLLPPEALLGLVGVPLGLVGWLKLRGYLQGDAGAVQGNALIIATHLVSGLALALGLCCFLG